MSGLLDSLLGRDIPPSKIVHAYRFQQYIVIHDHTFTRMRMIIPCAPYLSTSVDTSPDMIGRAILSLMARFNPEIDEIKNPINWQNWWQEYLLGLKINSVQELYECAVMLRVELYDDRICFLPTYSYENESKQKGFELLMERQFFLPIQSSGKQIGQALFQGFEVCTTIQTS